MTKVVKFGGTSLAEAKQFLKVADIIRSDPDRRYVVPSAPGKRFSGDTKVTDMFYACYDSASRGGDFEEIFQKIKNRYNDIISGLGLDMSLEDDLSIYASILSDAPAATMPHREASISTAK